MAYGETARQVLRSRISGSGQGRRGGPDGEARAIPSNFKISVMQKCDRICLFGFDTRRRKTETLIGCANLNDQIVPHSTNL